MMYKSRCCTGGALQLQLKIVVSTLIHLKKEHGGPPKQCLGPSTDHGSNAPLEYPLMGI